MRLANVNGRAMILTSEWSGVDVHAASSGRFGPAPGGIYDDWEQFVSWAATVSGATGARQLTATAFEPRDLHCPSPAARQVVAIGLNYSAHAAESGFEVPKRLPPTFTKFPSCLAGPFCEVELPAGGHTDWEVELVVAISKTAHRVPEDHAWDYVAGFSIGQDLSERVSQLDGPAPQFGLGKSFPRFGPVGPCLVTLDEVADRDNLSLSCLVNGETVQEATTKELIFPVSALIARLSTILTLYPGDLVFTGTPAGVGQGRTPQWFLKPGDELVSRIAGIGEIRQTFAAAKEA